LPKVGFRSRKSLTSAEVRLDVLANIEADVIDMLVLKSVGAVPQNTLRVKVIGSGEITKAITTKGLFATAGAVKAITAAGGKVEE
jgi:large subunit ribosomal protein L15